jgi:hypothetical protein
MDNVHDLRPKHQRPKLEEIAPEQLKKYLGSLDRLVQSVLPQDSYYVLAMVSRTGKVNWVSTLNEKSVASLMRQLGDFIDPPPPPPEALEYRDGT